MRMIQLTATADADGRVRLDVPAGTAGAEFEVAVVLHAKPAANGTGHKRTPEELGWPPGYFETTYGSIADDTFVRHPQPPLDPRQPIDQPRNTCSTRTPASCSFAGKT